MHFIIKDYSTKKHIIKTYDLLKMFYEIDLRMLKNVYKSSTKILQIVFADNFNPIDFM
jgi:hypothetical protein